MTARLKLMLNIVLFSRKTGYLRPSVRKILFDNEFTGRPYFKWITHKKSGRLKRKFLNIEQPGKNSSFSEKYIQLLTIERNNKENEALFSEFYKSVVLSNCNLLITLLQDYISSKSIIISFSHDNFKKVSGGIQLCVDKELASGNAEGWEYLHIYPLVPVTRLADSGMDISVGLSINGIELASCLMSELIELLNHLAEKKYDVVFVIHHLMGHAPEVMKNMIQKFTNCPVYFWVHDYFTLCRSYTLMQNGLRFCNAPPISSNACQICLYGEERQSHVARIRNLLSIKELKLVFPSEVARDMLAKSGIAVENAVILPHIALSEVHTQPAMGTERTFQDVITIAFIGTPAMLKGWEVFRQLTENYRQSSRFNFMVFSKLPPIPGNYRWVEVHTTANNLGAMTEALEKCQVDFVLNWPGWPETFSFVTCEALVAGAYIITNKWSGNVVKLIEKHGSGIVLDSHSELMYFISSIQINDAANFIRKVRKNRKFFINNSKMTLEILGNN